MCQKRAVIRWMNVIPRVSTPAATLNFISILLNFNNVKNLPQCEIVAGSINRNYNTSGMTWSDSLHVPAATRFNVLVNESNISIHAEIIGGQ